MIFKSDSVEKNNSEKPADRLNSLGKPFLLLSLCLLNVPHVLATPLNFSDGGIHNITGTVDDGIVISNGSTLIVKNGASVSASASLDGEAIRTESSSTINIQGGDIGGKVSFSELRVSGGKINGSVSNSNTPGGDFELTDGEIVGQVNMFGGNAEISGGKVGSVFSEVLTQVNISGGQIGSVETLSGAYNISGGSFSGELVVEIGGEALMKITGGNFTGGFRYGLSFGGSAKSFIFTGDLSLSPVVVTGSGAETTISGTFLDGSAINQTIKCSDPQCIGVALDIVRSGEIAFELSEDKVSENGSGLTLKVNRVNGSDGEVTVDFSSTDGSAKATTDYETVSGSLIFGDGETSRTVSVNILDDGDFEGDEDFTVGLNNVQGGAKLGDNSSIRVVIEEDDSAPPAGVFRFSGVDFDAVEGGSVTVTVQRDGGDFGTVSVDYSTTDGTANSGSDYQSAIGTLTFVDGEISQAINVVTINDSTFEDDEAFSIGLRNAEGGATLDTVTTATINIKDDDPAPSSGVIQFGEASYSVNEDGLSLNVTVIRESGSAGEISLSVNTVDGSATDGDDYLAVNGGVTFSDGETSKTIAVTILDDVVFEGDESFSMALSNVQGAATLGVASSVQIVIVEDDAAPLAGVLKFSGESFPEDESSASVSVTVQRVNGSSGQVSVDYNTVDVTATAGEDYQPANGTLNFADGELSQIIEVPLIGDAIFEGDETFNIELKNVQGGVSLDALSTAEVVIKEDDQAPQAGVLQFSGANYNVAEDDGSVVVEITRISGSAGRLIVDYSTSALTAIAGEDYDNVSGTLIFAPGAISRTVVVQISDDEIFEGDETFEMKLSNLRGEGALGAPETTTITINEDDPNPDEGNVTTDANTGDASDSGDDEPASTGSGVTGTSAISPISLLFLMTCLALFSNRLRKL